MNYTFDTIEYPSSKMCTVRLVNFVRFEKINGDFRKILGGYLKINGANWKMFGRSLANDCRLRNFTLSFWANSNWRY
jgi:hypothetical protein